MFLQAFACENAFARHNENVFSFCSRLIASFNGISSANYIGSPTSRVCDHSATIVQGERRGELAWPLLSRSRWSPLQLVCDGKGTKIINAKQYFPPIIFDNFHLIFAQCCARAKTLLQSHRFIISFYEIPPFSLIAFYHALISYPAAKACRFPVFPFRQPVCRSEIYLPYLYYLNIIIIIIILR